MSQTGELSPTYLRRLEPATCALCGSDRRIVRFKEQPYAVVLCKTCGLTYVTPRLPASELIPLVYDESYWRSPAARERGYTDYRKDADLYLRTFERRAGLIERYFGMPGRVLDVGCAAGYFLQVMAADGWDVYGIEPSPAIHATAAEALGAERVHLGSLATASFPPRSFELITLWDVLEHTPDPLDTLWRVGGLLKPHGKVVIETQNVKSLMARLLGRRWQHYKHAEHLFHFDRKTLRSALERSEMTVLEMTARYAGKQISPAFVVERVKRLHPWLSTMCKPLLLLPQRGMYVNLYDELIVVAEPA